MDDQTQAAETDLSDDMAALHEAIKAAGGVGALARLIGQAASAPSMWKARGSVPPEQGPDIERAVITREFGNAVTVERLCPHSKWVRMPDATWPHPKGRPLLDPSKQDAE